MLTMFVAVSGGFVPYPFIEDWIVWLQWISPVKYSFQAFCWSLVRGTSAEYLLLELELDSPSSATGNIGVLICFVVMHALASVFALSRQREVR